MSAFLGDYSGSWPLHGALYSITQSLGAVSDGTQISFPTVEKLRDYLKLQLGDDINLDDRDGAR